MYIIEKLFVFVIICKLHLNKDSNQKYPRSSVGGAPVISPFDSQASIIGVSIRAPLSLRPFKAM